MQFLRRSFCKQIAGFGAGSGILGCWANNLGANLLSQRSPKRLIVLWMPGGPSQMDTFDMKPEHANGGPFQEVSTTIPGMRFSEHLPKLSQLAHHLAIIRSVNTKEGDHSRGTYFVRTGQRPGSAVRYPALPAVLAKELHSPGSQIPGYVSILPTSAVSPAAFSAGFLGTSREPLTVGLSSPEANVRDAEGDLPDNNVTQSIADLRVDNLLPPIDLQRTRVDRRRELWNMLQANYHIDQRRGAAATHDTVYRRALQLTDSEIVSAFDLELEPETTRAAYGTSPFGQGCLMARRLIEHGVPVVEIALSDSPGGLGWDSHADNFATVQRLCGQLDLGWSQLLVDLEQRGLLQDTTIVWMGEFGRTPAINDNTGRDHFPNAFSYVLAGGSIQGGAIVGKTSDDGMEIVDRPVTIPEMLATISQAVGIVPSTENVADDRRPIKIAEGEPVSELLASTTDANRPA